MDDPDSRVDVASTARADLLGIWRMVRRFAAGEGAVPPGALAGGPADSVGVAGLRGPNAVAGLRGPNAVAGLRGPNAVAGLRRPNAVAGLRGQAGRARHYTAGLAVALLPLGLTLATLAVLDVTTEASLALAMAALCVANAAATVARFVLLHRWVFRP